MNKNRLFYYLLFAFFVFSWPFIYFPLTDGDITNWIAPVKAMQASWNFCSTVSDQSHGPLLAWTASVLTFVSPKSFYLYNLFNLLCGLFGVWFTYWFSFQLWKKKELSLLATYLFSTSIAVIYLSRTPMYDWPAAMAYYGFCGFYYLFLQESLTAYSRKGYFYLGASLLLVGIGSLSRFSITIGLSGIFMILVNLIYRRSFWHIVRDGFLILGAGCLANAYWVIKQTETFGDAFYRQFFFDNIGRFVKDSPGDPVRRDYVGFIIYTLVGILPHTAAFLATCFQKVFIERIKNEPKLQMLMAGFLPCLILFSLSGHTKLGRYIAYVFPFLLVFFAFHFLMDLQNQRYRGRVAKILLGLIFVLLVLLVALIFQFKTEAQSSFLFVGSAFVFLFSLLGISFYTVFYRYQKLLKDPTVFLIPYFVVYGFFFTVLTYISLKADFLLSIRQSIQGLL